MHLTTPVRLFTSSLLGRRFSQSVQSAMIIGGLLLVSAASTAVEAASENGNGSLLAAAFDCITRYRMMLPPLRHYDVGLRHRTERARAQTCRLAALGV